MLHPFIEWLEPKSGVKALKVLLPATTELKASKLRITVDTNLLAFPTPEVPKKLRVDSGRSAWNISLCSTCRGEPAVARLEWLRAGDGSKCSDTVAQLSTNTMKLHRRQPCLRRARSCRRMTRQWTTSIRT